MKYQLFIFSLLKLFIMGHTIIIGGYREVSYAELQRELNLAYQNSGKSFATIAGELRIKSISSISSILNAVEQIASDKILTGTMTSLDLKGCVVWEAQQKKYFIKKNN